MKTSNPHRLLRNLAKKIDLRRKDKYIALSYKNKKFKISAPTWKEEFQLPHGSYSISDIQDYFEYILKRHGEKTFNKNIYK